MARCGGRLGALENRCPHQGGPLGEGSIEKGLLRCPWHGYDYDPLTGLPPEGFSDAPAAYEVEEREDGAYVALPPTATRVRTVERRARRDADGMGHRLGVRHGRALQPRVRRCHASGGGARSPPLHRDPPRRCCVLRRQRVRQAHRPTSRLLRDRRPRINQPAHRPVRREGRLLAGRRSVRAGPERRARARCVPRSGSLRGLPRRRGVDDDADRRQQPRRARWSGRQARDRSPRGRAPGPARRSTGPPVGPTCRVACRPARRPASAADLAIRWTRRRRCCGRPDGR